MLYGMTLAAVVIVTGIIISRLQRRTRPALGDRVHQGNLHRFDSVTKLLDFCRHRYRADKVHCSSETGEFLLHVELPSGESFESLVVHLDGEGVYAVRLPEP